LAFENLRAANENLPPANAVGQWVFASFQNENAGGFGGKTDCIPQLKVFRGRKQSDNRRRNTYDGAFQHAMACRQACCAGRAMVSHGLLPCGFRALFGGWEAVWNGCVSPGETGADGVSC